jgi:hypothetical protein
MVLGATSCKKSGPEGGVMIDLSNDIHVVSKDGQNLLDPVAQNSFNKDEIKIYYLINGKKTEILDNKLDAPRQFMIFKVGADAKNYANEPLMRIFSNDNGVVDQDGNEIATTYIEWNSMDTDTLVSQIRHSGASIYTEKVWYNGIIKWDIMSTPKVEDKSFSGRFFQIIK